MTLRRIVAGGAALALLMLPGGPVFSFAAGSSLEANLEAVAPCDQDARPANLDFTLQDMNGADGALAAFRGKVILLNLWGDLVRAVQIRGPWLRRASGRLPRSRAGGARTVRGRPSQQDHGLCRRVQGELSHAGWLGRDDVQEAYGPILGMPTTFFIKRDGTVCKTHTGLATKDDIEQDIKELL